MSAEFPGSDDRWADGPANRLDPAGGLRATPGVDGTHSTYGADGTHSTYGADGTHSTYGADGTQGTYGADGTHGTHAALRASGDTIAFGSPSRGSRSRRSLVIAGVAAAALIGGASVAYAAGSSGPVSTTAASASPSATPPAPPSHPGFRRLGGFGGPFGFGGPIGLGFGGLFGAVHGQLVVPKSSGGYLTIDIQSGQVMAVSSSSITLKSADGFTRSYAVTASTLVDAQRDGIGSVKVGNQASVLATVSGSAATAVSVTDTTLLRTGHHVFGWSGYGQGSSGAPGGQNS